jgi:hypothetical protein
MLLQDKLHLKSITFLVNCSFIFMLCTSKIALVNSATEYLITQPPELLIRLSEIVVPPVKIIGKSLDM